MECLPVFQTNQTQIINFDDFEPLGEGVENELDPVLGQLDRQVKGEGVPVAVGDLHPLDGAHMVLN